jgi:hypothetical protein
MLPCLDLAHELQPFDISKRAWPMSAMPVFILHCKNATGVTKIRGQTTYAVAAKNKKDGLLPSFLPLT